MSRSSNARLDVIGLSVVTGFGAFALSNGFHLGHPILFFVGGFIAGFIALITGATYPRPQDLTPTATTRGTVVP